jgi:glycosyltransferase involved in cell wall biosynthesis
MLLPSFAEGLPMVIMEALALGRPVVTTAIAGIPELVDSGCGWLVPAGDVNALVEAIVQLLDASPQDLAAKGEEGRRRVLARHLSSANGAELYGLFGAMAANAGGRQVS